MNDSAEIRVRRTLRTLLETGVTGTYSPGSTTCQEESDSWGLLAEVQWLCPRVPEEKIQTNIKPRVDPKRAAKHQVCREASLRERGTWTGGSTRQREACPHLEAKATLDTLRDALMLSQLTTKHCIPKGGSSKLRDEDRTVSAGNVCITLV